MPLILGTNSIKDTGYDVANSLRFNSGSSDDLVYTPSSTGNRRTFTWSVWVKRSKLGAGQVTLFKKVNLPDENRKQFELYDFDYMYFSFYCSIKGI